MAEGGQPPQEDLVPKIGTFMVLMGIFSIIFFVTSDSAGKTDFDWLFVGMVLLGIGYVFRRRAPPPPSAGRFAFIRKMRENAKKRKADKADKNKKAKKK